MSDQQILSPANSAAPAEVDPEALRFGAYLRSVRNAHGVSLRTLAKRVGKTSTYLSDIENGNNKPPERELMSRITEALGLAEGAEETERLYDLAAAERGDIPADIKSFLSRKPYLIPIIRYVKNAPNGDALLQQTVAGIRSACL